MNSQRAVTPWEADFCDMRAAMPIPGAAQPTGFKLLEQPAYPLPRAQPRLAHRLRRWTGHADRRALPGPDARLRHPRPCDGPDVRLATVGRQVRLGHAPTTATSTRPARSRDGSRPRPRGADRLRLDDGPQLGTATGAGKAQHELAARPLLRDLAVHGIFGFDPASNGNELRLAHGYVLDHGKVRGLKAGTRAVEGPQERYPEQVLLELTDSGDQARSRRRALTTYPVAVLAEHGFVQLAVRVDDGRTQSAMGKCRTSSNCRSSMRSTPTRRPAAASRPRDRGARNDHDRRHHFDLDGTLVERARNRRGSCSRNEPRLRPGHRLPRGLLPDLRAQLLRIARGCYAPTRSALRR